MQLLWGWGGGAGTVTKAESHAMQEGDQCEHLRWSVKAQALPSRGQLGADHGCNRGGDDSRHNGRA